MRCNVCSFHNEIRDTDFTVFCHMTREHLDDLMHCHEGRVIVHGCSQDINADGQTVVRVEITFKKYMMSLEAILAGAAIVLIDVIFQYLIKCFLSSSMTP